jgi:hypothetical protein
MDRNNAAKYRPGLFMMDVWMDRGKNMPKAFFRENKFEKLMENLYRVFTIKTEGTGLCPSLSEGLIVSFPFTKRQLLPPPSTFIASRQPSS